MIESISGLLFLLTFTSIFKSELFGEKSINLINIALAFNFLLIGAVLSDLLFHNNNLLKIVSKGGRADIIITIYLDILIFIAIFLLMTGVYFGIIHQKSILPDYPIKRVRITSTIVTMGMLVILILHIINPGAPDLFSQIVILLGFVLMITGLVMILISLFENPLTNAYFKSNASVFLSHDIISFVLIANKDTGPKIISKSENFQEITKISEMDLKKFGLKSVALAYDDQHYSQNVSLSPFTSNNDFIVLKIPFVTTDNALVDTRLKNRSFGIFSIFIPSAIMYLFTQPLNEIKTLDELMTQYLKKYQSLDQLNDLKILSKLAEDMLDRIF